jgi:hypothetical protein
MANVLHALRKRPLTSLGVAGFGGTVIVAGLVEAHAEWQEQRSARDTTGGSDML